MADLAQHSSYNAEYSGLIDNLYLTLAIAGACLIGYELEIHVPRQRGREGASRRIPVRVYLAVKRGWKRWKERGQLGEKRDPDGGEHIENSRDARIEAARRRLGSREAWEFGYIHQPKAWALNPSPPVRRLPLAWIVSALRISENDMPSTCGIDITLHARFLRGAFFYTLLQCLIVVPILMPLHYIYSPNTVAKTSMLKASITSLVESDGTRWLWVHAVLVWWVGISWTMTALWIAWGAIAYRRREVERLKERVLKARKRTFLESLGEDGTKDGDDVWSVKDGSEGIKRFRTLMVTNVPPDMRDDQTLRDYFDYYLRRYHSKISSRRNGNPSSKTNARTNQPEPSIPERPHNQRKYLHLHYSRQVMNEQRDADSSIADHQDGRPSGEEPADEGVDMETTVVESEVDEVVLVRKLAALESLRSRRQDVLKQLEVAHVNLAKRILKAVEAHKNQHHDISKGKSAIHPVHDMEKGLRGLNAAREEKVPSEMSRHERLDKLVEVLGGFVDDEPAELGEGGETVWDVLHALPRELLDPYQSLTHLPITSIFRDQNAPLIDYLTTKLSYLTSLLNEARSKPLSSYAASSTAFVTFKDARTARLALKILDSHPRRSLACHTSPAPEWTDLLWPRLGKNVYRSEFVRGWVVAFGVWAFTLAWIFPVSLFCAIASLSNIAGFIAPLQAWLSANPNASKAITSLAPVILVALLTLAICPILLVIANKAETIVTRTGIHNSVMGRFWKFLMVNGVIFFAIGQTAIEAYLTAFQSNEFDPLPIVSSAFPTAAPYFASYILLQVAIQPFFEIFRFGLPTIIYVFGTRVSTIPRQRDSRTRYPTFSHFSQVPQQLLAGAIMHLFMLLNPLVIPFTLIFYGALYVVWKRQFTYVYGRLYETNGRRSSVRILRYSMDALALGQFVLFAFFVLQKVKGHAIATGILFFITLISKLVITRALKRRFDKLDWEEADILCPPVSRDDETINNNPDSNEFGLIRDSEDMSEGELFRDAPKNGIQPGSSPGVTGHFGTLRTSLSRWVGKWGYATVRSRKAGHRDDDRPIPFDQTFFSSLDRKITFNPDSAFISEKTSSHLTTSSGTLDAELSHDPDHAINHTQADAVVLPHHPLRAWEDIPPYQRARGYNDQPAYTDDYDDFLWLPRDPLSKLDLDDTVEMRLSLTTSAGGSGKIGDWPPTMLSDETRQEQEYLQVRGPARDEQPVSPISGAPPDSPEARSERRLIGHLELSPHIGSEVGDREDGAATLRRGTQRAALGFSQLFKRPRASTKMSGGGISLATMSSVQTPAADEFTRVVSSTSDDGNRDNSTSTTATSGTIGQPSMLLSPNSGEMAIFSLVRATSPVPMVELTESGQTTVPAPVPSPSPALPTTPLRAGSQFSVLSSLGRSPSRRRPTTATSAASMDGKTPGGNHLLRSTSTIASRSGSRSGRMNGGRDRASSALSNSSIQQALVDEVMAEERRLAKERREQEGRDLEEEGRAVEKEREREREREKEREKGKSGSVGDDGIFTTRRVSHVEHRDQ